MNRAQALYGLIREVRRSFQELADLGDKLHADRKITSAQRALLEELFDAGESTVPRIAERKTVSRQHIQKVADGLIARGLVETHPNPAHKRSVLVALTARGKTVFTEMRRDESALLKQLGSAFRQEELQSASETLAKLREQIAPLRKKEDRYETC